MFYDVTVITETEKDVDSALNHFKDTGATVKQTKKLGSRPFSYPIDKKIEGVYTDFALDLPSDKVVGLNKELAAEPKVIRHLTLTTDTTELPQTNDERRASEPPRPVSTAGGPEQTEKISEKTAEKKSVAVTEESKKTTKAKTTKESKADTAERQEALNKKLEQILES